MLLACFGMFYHVWVVLPSSRVRNILFGYHVHILKRFSLVLWTQRRRHDTPRRGEVVGVTLHARPVMFT